MLYAKIENGNVTTSKGTVFYMHAGRTLTLFGYKPVVESEMIEVPEGHEAVPVYTDEGDTIIKSWQLTDKTPTLEDRVSAVEDAIIEIAEEISNG